MMMSQVMQYEFRLFGGRANKTLVINGHKFVQGICRKVVAPIQAATLIKVLGYYGAYAKGTPQYDKALEAENGGSKVRKDAERRAAETVQGDRGPVGSELTGLSADDRVGTVENSSVGAGSGALGGGLQDTGIIKFEESANIPKPSEPQSVASDDVKRAILKLDPENDGHWVNTGAYKGKPKLVAVEEAFGRAGLTRKDLEAALPNWSRDNALETALEG
jgi:hypothetical protein